MNLPDPVKHMKINVRSVPGQSYPQPVSRVHIREQNIHPGFPSGMPASYHHSQNVGQNQGGGAYCPPE
jgi:hypothetical protein